MKTIIKWQHACKHSHAIHRRTHKSINPLKLNQRIQHEHKSRLKRIGANDKAQLARVQNETHTALPSYGTEWRHWFHLEFSKRSATKPCLCVRSHLVNDAIFLFRLYSSFLIKSTTKIDVSLLWATQKLQRLHLLVCLLFSFYVHLQHHRVGYSTRLQFKGVKIIHHSAQRYFFE